MIILFGWKARSRDHGYAASVATCCPHCGQQHFHVTSVRKWFTLFFIPLVPIGRDHRIAHCTHCAMAITVDSLDLATPPRLIPAPAR
jgi:hypothetical protein